MKKYYKFIKPFAKMKQLIAFFLALILAYSVKAQVFQQPNTSWGLIWMRTVPDSTAYIPTFNVAPSGKLGLHSQGFNGNGQKLRMSALYYDSTAKILYVYSPKDSSWGPAGGGTIVDTSLFLRKALNLSDLSDPVTARTNLGISTVGHTGEWLDILDRPTTIAGYGITDPIVYTSGSYANPSWITSLAYSKITGVPNFMLNSGNSVGFQEGIFSARPVASNCKCYYAAIDSTAIYYDNGSWIKMASAGTVGSFVANGGGAPQIIEDIAGAIPGSATTGSLFIATDTHVIYRFNGASWDVIAQTLKFGVSGQDDIASASRSFNMLTNDFGFGGSSGNFSVILNSGGTQSTYSQFAGIMDGSVDNGTISSGWDVQPGAVLLSTVVNSTFQGSFVKTTPDSLIIRNDAGVYFVYDLPYQNDTSANKVMVYNPSTRRWGYGDGGGGGGGNTIYTGGGTIPTDRYVYVLDGKTLQFIAKDTIINDSFYTELNKNSWAAVWEGADGANLFSFAKDKVRMRSQDQTNNFGGEFRIDGFDNQNGAIYEDFNISNPTGIKYAANNYVTNPLSLTTKEYVDSIVHTITPTNGLQALDSVTIGLGTPLIENTSISLSSLYTLIIDSANGAGGFAVNFGSDATGDMFYRNSGGLWNRLPIGTTKQKLGVIAGLPAWVDSTAVGGGGAGMAIGNPITSATSGSVLFAGASGKLSQINTKFFYDSTNVRLEVGGNSPTYTIQAEGTLAATSGSSYIWTDPSFPSSLAQKWFQSGVGDWRLYLTSNGSGGNLAFEFKNTNSSLYSSIIAKEIISGTPVTDQSIYGGASQYAAFRYTSGQEFFQYYQEAGARNVYGIGAPTGQDYVDLRMNNATTTTTGSLVERWHDTQAIEMPGKLEVGSSTSATSTLHVTGSAAYGYRAITALRTLDATDHTVNCTANSFTVTLPTAVGCTDREYIIKNTGTATTITMATTSSQTIDGTTAGSFTITTLVPLKLRSDGANWITW